ncbi:MULTISPECIES: CsbD family protein [unclassified Mycobacterium]|uniref:microaggregate-binding protein 1 n=1 Tax=unclassified Mycobacterium TaxID=2642494 RepID=UPI0029C98FC7|nr:MULTISPECIES: CsbD family protein [unclassified Mycobacterium]
MADKDTGPEAAVKGIVEDVAGKAKEVAGTVFDRKDLKHEGQAQQDKADAQRDVAKKEAEAEASRAAAAAAETREEAARRA